MTNNLPNRARVVGYTNNEPLGAGRCMLMHEETTISAAPGDRSGGDHNQPVDEQPGLVVLSDGLVATNSQYPEYFVFFPSSFWR